MVPQCCMLLSLCVYGLQRYGHLYDSGSLCFLFNSVLWFKILIGINRYYCCFKLGLLNDHLFGKELFLRFTVCILRGHPLTCELFCLFRFDCISS